MVRWILHRIFYTLINFYQLFPLYKEELEYKFHHDADSLLQRFDEEALSGVIDNQRKNFGIE